MRERRLFIPDARTGHSHGLPPRHEIASVRISPLPETDPEVSTPNPVILEKPPVSRSPRPGEAYPGRPSPARCITEIRDAGEARHTGHAMSRFNGAISGWQAWRRGWVGNKG